MGRGWLSSLDLLPDEAQDDLTWALGQLNERQRTQADILEEFNDRLGAKGIGQISRSAFSRKATRLARRNMLVEERKFIYAGIAEKLTPEEVGKSDVVLGEFLKTLLDEILEQEGLNSKNAMELARAYKDTISGQIQSAQHRRKANEEARGKLVKAVDAVEEAVGSRPDGKELLRKIREDIYGIFEQ